MSDVYKELEQFFLSDREQDPSAVQRLEAWLLADTARVQEFAELLLQEQQLRDRAVSVPRAAAADDRRSAAARWPSYSAWAQFAIAASILAAATVGFLGIPERNAVGPEPSPPLQAAAREVSPTLAYLGRARGCDWNGEPLSEGTQLRAGASLELVEGIAEVIFENGARVATRGPCQLTIDGPTACSLSVGSASVHVPETAFGFKVTTPSGIVIDLGTDFGVAVDQQGASEVHVFKGEVAFQALTAAGGFHERAVRLTESQACKHTLGGVTLEEFKANEARFLWRKQDPLPESELPPLPVRDDLVLWLAADRAVEVDAEGRVERWRDLLSGDNLAAEDALQLNPKNRPGLAPKGLNGRPAIRFGGSDSFLLTPPISSTNEQTAVVVAALRESYPNFQSLINYNGPPQRIVGSVGGRVRPAVFEICLRDRDSDKRFAVCGELFGGFRDGAPKSAETVDKEVVEVLNALPVDHPKIIVFRYSLSKERMSLFINGNLRASDRASLPIAIASRKIIGRHPVLEDNVGGFRGDIGELLLFNRALTDAEVADVSEYLCLRFGLAQR
ncbi:FecR protein [Pirellulimonas nuda]|uniref:FecR protein n=1 Tax=Pirellulimonas nuda TaxID=2528009 RepID=A0A518DDS0_9BACT|nr:LamG-like jellyroll fold domain-containing protein [Pirellulimonas nuda]QDU89628.1 FecR protein [Pirellulimonas nuda]